MIIYIYIYMYLLSYIMCHIVYHVSRTGHDCSGAMSLGGELAGKPAPILNQLVFFLVGSDFGTFNFDVLVPPHPHLLSSLRVCLNNFQKQLVQGATGPTLVVGEELVL